MANQHTRGGVRYQRPQMTTGIDFEESRGYLDSSDFAAYCLEVHAAIAAIGEANIAEIKRHFESEHHNWLMDAIDALTGIGSIQQTRYVSPLRWVVKDIPVVKTRGYNSHLLNLPAASLTRPYYEKKRVLA